MKQAEEPNLADLKKLLRRLEKIDPETASAAPSGAAEPATAAVRKPKQAILDRPANDAAPADALLQLNSRDGGKISREPDVKPAELPVIVKHSLPATIKSSDDAGTFRTVIIASVTAAVVSALATAGTVYWLNRGAVRVAYERPAISAVPAPQQSAASTAAGLAPSAEAPAAVTAATLSAPDTVKTTASGTGTAAPDTNPETATSQSVPQQQVSNAVPETSSRAAGQDAGASGSVEAVEEVDAEATAAAASSTLVASQTGGSETADVAAATAELPARETVNLEDQAAGITPPRPQLAGIPDVSGEIAVSNSGTQVAAAAMGPDPMPSGADSASEKMPQIARTVSGVSAAREIVAAAGPAETGVEAVVAEPSDTGTPNASAETEAPLVAAYDAPIEVEPTGGDATSASSTGTPVEQPGAPAAAVPLPQVGPGEVLLHHEELVRIAAGEPVPFPLQVIGAPEDLQDHHLIISGLKRGSTLSSGTELMFDAWRVDVTELPNLKLIVPAGFAHRLHILADLRRPDGTTRQKTNLALSVPGVAADVAPDAEEAKGLDQEVLRNVDAGEVEIDNGRMSAARILFERAAGAGSARAAMLLAATYDPNYSHVFKTLKPPAPDLAQARKWYARAADLGASLAGERLARIEAR